MPGGLDPTSLTGYIGFATVKYLGYSISGAIFTNYYPDKKSNLFVFGLVRTGIGIVLGAAVGLIALVKLDLALYLFLFGLIPVRIVEWLVTLRLFYSKSEKYKGSLTNSVALGIAWSFALDIPAIPGFLFTGGLWIC